MPWPRLASRSRTAIMIPQGLAAQPSPSRITVSSALTAGVLVACGVRAYCSGRALPAPVLVLRFDARPASRWTGWCDLYTADGGSIPGGARARAYRAGRGGPRDGGAGADGR